MADLNNDWANLRVSREEYEASLRDSVNAYYEHAMSDPNMSREEAIQSTAQMAEEYETAMAEFDQAAAEQNSADNGVNDDGGLDGGGLE